jgi:hypothetical protein
VLHLFCAPEAKPANRDHPANRLLASRNLPNTAPGTHRRQFIE